MESSSIQYGGSKWMVAHWHWVSIQARQSLSRSLSSRPLTSLAPTTFSPHGIRHLVTLHPPSTPCRLLAASRGPKGDARAQVRQV